MLKKNFIHLALAGALLAAAPGWADSLFVQPVSTRQNSSNTLIAEKSARFEVGDIITVMVRERIDAETAADTNTKKESDVGTVAPLAANGFLVNNPDEGGMGILNPGELPNWGGETENETKNRGTTTRESSLTTQVGCVVREVYPNGNLLIEGQRKVTVNREDSTLLVTGMIRSKDVLPNNTIASTQMANAQILLKGKGELWNNQRRGFLTKVVDWVNPF